MTRRIYCDGAYSAKKQAGGWSVFVPSTGFAVSGRDSGPSVTNNTMELYAAWQALLHARLIHPRETVCIVTDSKYVITVITSGRDYVPNHDLIERSRTLIRHLSGVISFEWVKGHSGDPHNHVVDINACRARDGKPTKLALKKLIVYPK